MPERCRGAITISAQGTRRPRTSETQTQDKAINHESSTTPFCPRDHNGIRDGQLHFELLAPKATAMAAEDLGDLQAEILEVKHAILEAPKQPKKQDETEAPPGWNRSRQGPEKGPNPDGSGRGKIPGFGGRQNLCTLQ